MLTIIDVLILFAAYVLGNITGYYLLRRVYKQRIKQEVDKNV